MGLLEPNIGFGSISPIWEITTKTQENPTNFLFFSHFGNHQKFPVMSGLLVFISRSVRYWHIPEDCDVFLCYYLGLIMMLARTTSRLCLCSSLCRCSRVGMSAGFVLSVKIFSFGQLRAPFHNMVNSFLKLTTNPAHWVCTIL